ncbi:MarR family transcriptional regulator [Nocardia camponoti]|uniref:MarR family transcriptional regulator n=2 Tax=Nocardia camponoti TaxID=1616106 RepID=A0A917VE77_9NOCA|nr:MarR family transcriptional regulator [Nocardia camponoti]
MWSQLAGLYGRIEARLGVAVQRGHGIGLSEYRALEQLSTNMYGELRMQELADRIGLNQSSVTRLVGRLASSGLALRDTCPNDGRGVYAVITAEGRAKLRAARSDYAKALAEALDEAGPLADALRSAFAATVITDE